MVLLSDDGGVNGRSSRRGNTAKAPAQREPLKAKKRTPVEERQERHEEDRLGKFSQKLHEAQRSFDAEADEVMAQTYGPHWRTRDDIPW